MFSFAKYMVDMLIIIIIIIIIIIMLIIIIIDRTQLRYIMFVTGKVLVQ